MNAKKRFPELAHLTNEEIRKLLVFINGIIAGILANLLLAVALYYTLQLSDELAWVVSPEEVGCVMGAVVLCGILLCWIATLFAANKYLRLDYDALFKR